MSNVPDVSSNASSWFSWVPSVPSFSFSNPFTVDNLKWVGGGLAWPFTASWGYVSSIEYRSHLSTAWSSFVGFLPTLGVFGLGFGVGAIYTNRDRIREHFFPSDANESDASSEASEDLEASQEEEQAPELKADDEAAKVEAAKAVQPAPVPAATVTTPAPAPAPQNKGFFVFSSWWGKGGEAPAKAPAPAPEAPAQASEATVTGRAVSIPVALTDSQESSEPPKGRAKSVRNADKGMAPPPKRRSPKLTTA